jgi:hypothetical protein
VVGVYLNDVLNIREQPGVSHAITATIPPLGRGVRITGERQAVNNSIWAPVRYQDAVGWVNTYYLARQRGSASPALASRARTAILALKETDWDTLASLVHPETCLRFSPYPYVQKNQDLVFCPEEIQGFPNNTQVYTWGQFDGSGKPIDMTVQEYYDRFLYDADFAHPEEIGYNVTLGSGNMINNLPDVYPQADFIEYHFSGFDPQYGGMDWRSIRLVFENIQGTWYLVGLIHAEWTI